MKNANKTQPATWKVGTSWSPDSSVSLHEVKAAGLNCIELVISRDQPDLSIRGLTNKFDPYILKAKNIGLEIWSIHFPFGEVWDISTIDVFKRNEIIRSHEEWLQWVSDWGIKNVIIHPSYEPISGNDRKKRIEASKNSLYQLAEKARQININTCVEDLPRTCLGNTSEEIKTLIEVHENLRVCFDVNHLLLETHVHFLREIGTKIATVHISDYDGLDEKHWLPGKGIIKWNEVIHGLVEFGYKGPFMFEVKKDENHPDQLMECWNHLLEAYNKVYSY